MENDLISRKALLSGVMNVRKVCEYDETGCSITYKAVPVEVIEKAPSIDAVEVVRCNLCKFYEQETGFCYYYDTGNHWDGFCNHGIRREPDGE